MDFLKGYLQKNLRLENSDIWLIKTWAISKDKASTLSPFLTVKYSL
jgi:hypothetical protein